LGGRDAGLDGAGAAVLPGVAAEHEHVALGQGLDELLVDRADGLVVEAHGQLGAVGDRADVRVVDRAGLLAAPSEGLVLLVPPDLAVDALVLELVGALQVRQAGLVVLAREVAVGVGLADALQGFVGVPHAGEGHADDVLAEDVQGLIGDREGVELALAGVLGDHGALDEVVVVERDEQALALGAQLVPGAADALQGPGDATRRGQQHDEVDRADVDAELEARARDDGVHLALAERVLDLVAALLGEGAVVGADRALKAVGVALDQAVHDALGPGAGVREDERGVVLADLLVEGLVQLVGDLGPAGGQDVVGRAEDVDLDVLGVGHVDDLAGPRAPLRVAADEEAGDLVQRVDRGRETDAHGPALGRRSLGWGLGSLAGLLVGLAFDHRLEPFEGEHEVRAAFALGQGVDLVDDDPAGLGQVVAERRRVEQDAEALGRRDQDVRRRAGHLLPLAFGRVPGADAHADAGVGVAGLDQLVGHALERGLEVALDVVVQRLQRGDVQDVDAVLQPAVLGFVHELVDPGQERGQRLAGAGGAGDEHVVPVVKMLERVPLGWGEAVEPIGEPVGDLGFEDLSDLLLAGRRRFTDTALAGVPGHEHGATRHAA
jgi:hypothetical protein